MKATACTHDSPVCPMNYPGFVFRELQRMGYRAELLFEGTQLTEDRLVDSNFRVDFSTLRQLILNAMKVTGDPHLGPRLARRFEANYIGLPAYTAMNAARLIDGLDLLQRFSHLTFPAIEIEFSGTGINPERSEAEIRLRARFQLGDVAYFVIGTALFVLHNLMKDMLRMPLVAAHAEVTIPEPSGWTVVRHELSRVSVTFEAQHNRILFPAALLNQRLPGSDPINHQRLVALCERLSIESAHLTTPISQVRSFLEGQKTLAKPLSEAAPALGYSERSLRRQLERSGTTYRKLVEQLLESRAKDMLANSTIPVSTIAYELGYETPSNFARSFKRWTGETPKAFRERKRGT